MNTTTFLQRAAISLAALGILTPPATLRAAAQPKPLAVQTVDRAVADVALNVHGALRGRVVDRAGVAQAKQEIVVRQGDVVLARTTTDERGAFTVAGLRGGTYEVGTGQTTGTYRLWTAPAAPPKAGEQALLVVGQNGARGNYGMIAGGSVILFGIAIAALIVSVLALDEANDEEDSDGPVVPSPASN
jgi:hypothetical protein